MNFNKCFFIVIISIFVFGCNNSKVNKIVDEFETSADNDAWLIKLSEQSALNAEELTKLFPAELQDMPLVGVESIGVQKVIGTYSKVPDPNYMSSTISVTIVDGAGTVGMPHVNAIFKELNTSTNTSFENGWAKTTMHNGQSVLVKEQTKTEKTGIQSTVTSSIDMIKNQRFHINLTGRHIPGNQLTKALDEVIQLSFPE
ncbi:hypothetical protein FJ651_03175 [Paucihalobacter ruber]|uniref:DUF5642 domain-containing protein n=1 Tax=Paucihalobacter ruber TaxID=2567861 RepID=A0A506PRW7_9FLAO|nr:hypothetical protein [Paucihalobacter ruber]TPV35935.1 hypothetical protein FJ651_03175 [Paucihalobacter ruber]